jgi:nucleoid-associated protein YgaU
MGRETKLLLALLATLAGVFVGVLSMKLLVARPPTGAGPDVHVDMAAAEPHELVAPPTLSPQSATVPSSTFPGDRRLDSGDVVPGNDVAQAAAFDREVVDMPPRRDPFVAATSFEQPSPGAERQSEQPPAAERAAAAGRTPSASVFAPPASDIPPDVTPAAVGRQAIEPAGAPAIADVPVAFPETASPRYVTAAGDSWWDLAERAYGDGRLYRALYAWNRVVDPRVTLAPGTRLEIPSRERLEAAWPRLAVPR